MLLILINLICIGNNEGIPNEVQADGSRSIPREQRFDPLIAGQVAKDRKVCVCICVCVHALPLYSIWRWGLGQVEDDPGTLSPACFNAGYALKIVGTELF